MREAYFHLPQDFCDCDDSTGCKYLDAWLTGRRSLPVTDSSTNQLLGLLSYGCKGVCGKRPGEAHVQSCQPSRLHFTDEDMWACIFFLEELSIYQTLEQEYGIKPAWPRSEPE